MRLLPRKRRWRVLFVLVVVLAVAWFAVPQLLVPTIQRKLQAMIATQLKAEVKIGSIRYAPPYGVRVRGVSLVAEDPKHGRVEVLKVAVLDLKLAKLPIGKGPLVIENMTIREPELHVVLADGTIVGRGHIVRPPGERGKSIDELIPPGTRVSEMFQLRHFGMHGGRVVFENRDRPGSAPMAWAALDMEMETGPRSKSSYDFSFGTDADGPAQLAASGAFDLDELWVQIDKFHLAATAGAAVDQAALPSDVQAALTKYDVKGRVTLDFAGRADLRELPASQFSGALELTDASAAVPQRNARIDRLDLRLTFAKEPTQSDGDSGPPRPTVVAIERFSFVSGPARLTATLGAGSIDFQHDAWSVRDLRAELSFAPPTPTSGPTGASAIAAATQPSLLGPAGATGRATVRVSCGGKLGVPIAEGGVDVKGAALDFQGEGLTVLPPKFDTPFTEVSATIQKEAGSRAVLLSAGAGRYGNDRFKVNGARTVIPPDPRTLADTFRIDEITGTAEFGAPRAAYPLAFGNVIRTLDPGGVFSIGGGSWYSVSRVQLDPATTAPAANLSRRKGDYFFSVSADAGRFRLLDGWLPLTDVRGDATFSPLSVAVKDVRGNVLGGMVVGSFHVTPSKPGAFHGDMAFEKIQLSQAGEAFEMEAKHRERLKGEMFLNIGYAGEFPRKGSDAWLDTLRTEGQFEVFGGEFWTLPVVGQVVARTKQADTLTVGEAAGRFEVKGRKLHLTSTAVQSPTLGLMGAGTIGFDKSLDLKVIAAPLGDWRDRLKRGRIPILSDVAAEVFGTVQKILNAATSTLLYEFRVKGSLTEPKVETVPAPVLTEPAALLLGQMVRDVEGKERGKWSATARKKQ